MNRIVTCQGCYARIDESLKDQPPEPCPICGSTIRDVDLTITDTSESHEKIGFQAKMPGFKKTRREAIWGDEKFVDQNKWVHKERVIDRENNQYIEVVEDSITGEIIRQCHEPLTQHFGHGSAKHKKKGETVE